MIEAGGWAVMAAGARIYIRTVSETRRAAIINWLMTEKAVLVTTSHTDADIESMWSHHGKYVDCRRVIVSPEH